MKILIRGPQNEHLRSATLKLIVISFYLSEGDPGEREFSRGTQRRADRGRAEVEGERSIHRLPADGYCYWQLPI